MVTMPFLYPKNHEQIYRISYTRHQVNLIDLVNQPFKFYINFSKLKSTDIGFPILRPDYQTSNQICCTIQRTKFKNFSFFIMASDMNAGSVVMILISDRRDKICITIITFFVRMSRMPFLVFLVDRTSSIRIIEIDSTIIQFIILFIRSIKQVNR